jgi:magnesium and cobalt transporter
MGDSTDPSSGAAHRAQDPEDTDQTATPDQGGGFISRVIGLFSSPAPDTGSPPPVTHAQNAAGSGIGMGNLRRMRVEDVAIPRAEIVAVPADIGLPELVEVFKTSGMTRLPVYSRTLDTPIGLVHLKDFALNYGFNGKPAKFSLKGMVRPLLFAPPSMPIGVLLQKMQTERMHMALVVDEYGGVDGLVTIEDLIEQVVGEIADEHDTPDDALWTSEKTGCWLVQARAPLDELQAELGIDLTEGTEEEDVDTLGGLVFLLLGHVPARGEVVPHPSGAQFEIVDADARRIKRIRVRLPGSRLATAPAVRPAAE